MSRLDKERAVIRMAAELKVDEQSPVESIIRYCRQRVDRMLRDEGRTARTLAEVQAIVCEQLRLTFEEVWTDEDLERLIAKYVGLREFAFVTLRSDLDNETFGALLERRNVTAAASDRYVAVIDCRGPEKSARRFFTRWHEIAHLLTLTRQLVLPYHRSKERDPIERLMDAVAGEVGFYDPLFRPAVTAEFAAEGRLTFKGVERVRETICPDASFRSTLNACVSRTAGAVLLIEAGMGLKSAERASLESRQLMLVPIELPKPQLRVLVAMQNDAARKRGLRADRNMRVPSSSLVARHFAEDEIKGLLDKDTVESLSTWRHSDGVPVGSDNVTLQTRRVGDRILALVQPTARIKTPRVSHS